MPNIKAVIEYDGTDFHGFQKQPALRTVQGELERAVGKILRTGHCKVIGAGRTDAGVHATGQVVNFTTPDWMPSDRITVALNGVLPIDLRVRGALEVPETFHSRYSARARTYIYVVLNRETPSALLARYSWYIRHPLDVDTMHAAAAQLIGVRDFTSFGMPEKVGGSTVREIFDIRTKRWKDAVLIKVRANAFLRGMARAVVGTLVDVGRGRLSSEDVARVLSACDRDAVRVTAPPWGLYLTRVEY